MGLFKKMFGDDVEEIKKTYEELKGDVEDEIDEAKSQLKLDIYNSGKDSLNLLKDGWKKLTKLKKL